MLDIQLKVLLLADGHEHVNDDKRPPGNLDCLAASKFLRVTYMVTLSWCGYSVTPAAQLVPIPNIQLLSTNHPSHMHTPSCYLEILGEVRKGMAGHEPSIHTMSCGQNLCKFWEHLQRRNDWRLGRMASSLTHVLTYTSHANMRCQLNTIPTPATVRLSQSSTRFAIPPFLILCIPSKAYWLKILFSAGLRNDTGSSSGYHSENLWKASHLVQCFQLETASVRVISLYYILRPQFVELSRTAGREGLTMYRWASKLHKLSQHCGEYLLNMCTWY